MCGLLTSQCHNQMNKSYVRVCQQLKMTRDEMRYGFCVLVNTSLYCVVTFGNTLCDISI